MMQLTFFFFFPILQVSSIKYGMWDSIYDTFQALSQQDSTQARVEKNSENEIIDVEPSVRDAPFIADHGVECTRGE
jgi:hypothetical protein